MPVSTGHKPVAETFAPPWPPSPLEAVLVATASFTTTFEQGRGPFAAPVRLALVFNGLRTRVDVVDLPPISTPFGPDLATITKVGGGSGGYLRGSIAVSLTLRFGSGDAEPRDTDSVLDVTLTTASPGAPVDANGDVALAGLGVFHGGTLGGAAGTVIVRGRISPVP